MVLYLGAGWYKASSCTTKKLRIDKHVSLLLYVGTENKTKFFPKLNLYLYAISYHLIANLILGNIFCKENS